MQFTTLLPRHASKPGHRPEVIADGPAPGPDSQAEVSARVLVMNDGQDVLRLRVWTPNVHWVEIALSDVGDLIALTAGERAKDAQEDLESTMAMKGYVQTEHFRTLFTPSEAAFDPARRSSRLLDDAGRWQVSAKLLTPDDPEADALIQLRLWSGHINAWITLVVTAYGDIVAQTIGAVEKDAWTAAQAVMRRKGYEV